MKIEKYINTQCGIKKYNKLKIKTGILPYFRLYFFIIIAVIRDRFLKI
tara:strand:- start:6925 stop:7068 length:144 start_codon:yes stop_codon:yes gene_type:complete